MKKSGKEDFLDEAVQVYRAADCLCPAAGRATGVVAALAKCQIPGRNEKGSPGKTLVDLGYERQIRTLHFPL
jgi:hypothetical protein